MNPRIFVLSVVIALGGSFAGCSTRVATYSGPTRLYSDMATLPWDESQKAIRVISLDGRTINSSKPNLEMLPGEHVIEVMYRPAKTLHSYPVKVRFYADAGHRYGLSAKTGTGNISDDGIWAGKYEVSVIDLDKARVVARSNGYRASRYVERTVDLSRPAPGRDWDYE